MSVKEVKVEKEIGDVTLSIETGYIAKQASGSCMMRLGDTVVLTAVTTGPPRPGIDFFPLTVDYRERISAAGKFPGGFIKREGRPTTKEILTARLTDRPLRPLFPDWFRDEVQIQTIVMASDRENDADVLGINSASMALCLSTCPFEGPIGAVRLGQVDGEFIAFPTNTELEASDLDLVVAGNKENVLMIEGFAREMEEERMVEAILKAHEYIVQLCEMQEEVAAQFEVVKTAAPEDAGPNPVFDLLAERYTQSLKDVKGIEGKQDRGEARRELKDKIIAELIPDPEAEGAYNPGDISSAFSTLEKKVVRQLILEGKRPDGRAQGDLRHVECRVDVLPRVHGSAIFQRGETQAFITVTLGTSRDEQRVDGLMDEYSKKFMLDYNFPPFSVGECRPIRGPGRREIGHGALAERSVKSVLPDPEDFPYTIRVVSDITESNGSSSMASVCGATLGLMAAGVPILNPVAGISIGLVKDGPDQWVLLTDILGEEDHCGDMDFKVAGTQNGITGIQLDLKIDGINEAIVRGALTQAKEARLNIMRTMLGTISRPRPDISQYAPRLARTKIDPEKIGLLIGPGGKHIRALQEETDTVIEVQDDGTVTVAGNDPEGSKRALLHIEAMTGNVEVGRIYEGRVTSVKDFGAFVEILPGKDGLCHISELSDGYTRNVADICKVGDVMKVKVIAIDEQDRVKLSRRAAILEEEKPEGEEEDVEEVTSEEEEFEAEVVDQMDDNDDSDDDFDDEEDDDYDEDDDFEDDDDDFDDDLDDDDDFDDEEDDDEDDKH
ncbi:Polyribonucleotide nucleotidyltransferase [Planctomycetales bacterium 10988]|nr:Polyribonucleotide nucleotidyltransferase [Planctomycetales bacterium 10988]